MLIPYVKKFEVSSLVMLSGCLPIAECRRKSGFVEVPSAGEPDVCLRCLVATVGLVPPER
jgi:hypothetical protein